MSDRFVGPDFIARWEPLYDTKKYPPDFLLRYGANARNARSPEALKDALVALLHWKDGKADGFMRGESHAKRNTLRPVADLNGAALTEFARLFCALVAAQENEFTKCQLELRIAVKGLWKSGRSFVIPAFVLHVARPDRLPIIDQHTLRAYLWLTRGQFEKEPSVSWDLCNDYAVFFQRAVVSAGFSLDNASRGHVDRALFAYGKWLKGSYPHEKEKLLRERALTMRATRPDFANLWEEAVAEADRKARSDR